MITDAIIYGLFYVPTQLFTSLINALPVASMTIPDNVFNGFNQMLSVVSFIFPVTKLLPIIQISFGLIMFNIVWTTIIRIKSFIPTMGA